MKQLLSIFFVLIIVLLSVMPTYALDNRLVKSKLDDGLEAKLNDVSKDEKVTVSIWFDDVDEEQVKDKLYEKCKATKNSDIYNKIEQLLFGEVCEMPVGYSGDYLTYAKEYYKDITQEDFQYISGRKREAFRSEYKTHNQNMLNSLNDVLVNVAEVTFVSQYSPNIEIKMSKEDVLRIAELKNVNEIYFVENEFELIPDESEVSDYIEETSPTEPDDTYFHVTGLDIGRDVFNLTGKVSEDSVMKVGVIEYNNKLFANKFNNNNITILQQGSAQSDVHSSLVCGLMISNLEDFKGAIPEAHLFYTTTDGGVKSQIEALINCEVSAINCSFSQFVALGLYNTYLDYAKWYDHIAVQHNVHLILTAGNEGSLGVPSNTSYNAIVVGNCNKDGIIADSSSYISADNSFYKPDIVAPGVNLVNPFVSDPEIRTGTSFSAPLITSAVIQLCQASPILAANPTLMKSLLLSSATITDGMQNEPMYSVVGSNAIALSRAYGAGRLNLTKAYETFITKGNYITSSFSSNSTGAIFNRNITKVANKTLRFCLTWDKYNTVDGNHLNNDVNSPALDNLRLEVVTPSGVTYTSNFMFDNKQMITFNATENGYYSIRVYREGTANSNHKIDYSITYSAIAN